MYYTSNAPQPLTRVDVNAMLDAEQVVYRHLARSYDGTPKNTTGMGTLELTSTIRQRGREAEATTKLVVGSKIESWAKYREGAPDDEQGIDVDMIADDLDCFDMLSTARMNQSWQTVAMLARPGDMLTLYWRRGNSNGYMEKAGLAMDELFVLLTRPRGKPEQQKSPVRYTFQMRASVCEANSARMVRTKRERGGW